MRKIKIAQIGAGHDHAPAAARTIKLLEKEGIFDFVGFCRVPEDDYNIPEFSYSACRDSYKDIPELTLEEILNYDGLDAVAVETEDRALTKYAITAAERGLHVQMDKPGGTDRDEFERLTRIAEKNHTVLHIGYMYRYNPAVLKLKKEIAEGKLGEIISVEAQMNCDHRLPKRQWLGAYPGGMLYFLGCHMVDLVYSIMGEPEEIIPLSCSTGKDGSDAKDFGMAVFKYAHGVSFAKSSAAEVGGFERRQLVVAGTKGTVELRPFEWISGENDKVYSPQITTVREAYTPGWGDKGELHNSESYGRYDGMFRAFASYVNGEKQNPFTYEYERKLHDVLLKACGENNIIGGK